MSGYRADLDRAIDTGSEGETSVPQGLILRRFALALHYRQPKALEEARNNLIQAMGSEALVDATGVVAQFEAVNRVADASGTKIDDMIGQAIKAGFGPSKLPEAERD